MESSSILIDTSVLIDYFRKKSKGNTLLYSLSLKYSFAISTITEFEFLVGLSDKHLEFAGKLFKNFLILPFDSRCAKAATKIYNNLKSKNHLISPPDIFIAATAIANNLSFATLNLKHFERITNLELIALPQKV
jgi:predicted nucleic acid-binding protein